MPSWTALSAGALRGQPDAAAEVHLSVEKSSSAAAVQPAGLHEDAGESWTSADVQTERRLDRTLQVQILLQAAAFGSSDLQHRLLTAVDFGFQVFPQVPKL